MKYLQAGFDISGDGPVQTRLVTKLARPESLSPRPTQTDGPSNTVGQLPTGTIQNTVHLLTDSKPYNIIVSNPTQKATFNYNNAQSQPAQLQTMSALIGFRPSQTTSETVLSLIATATQSSVTSNDNQTQSSGAHNGCLIIGTIVGGVLGLFTCIIVVYCALNLSGKARKKRRQLELSYGNNQRGSDISLPRPWSELDHLYDRELDETILQAQAPAKFDPSPFQAEKLLKLNSIHASRYDTATGCEDQSTPIQPQRAKRSQEAKADLIRGKPMKLYQVRARPDIQPARKAPPPPPLRTQLEISHATRGSAHILSNRNFRAAGKTTNDFSPSTKIFDNLSRLRGSRLSVVSSVYSTYEPQELPETNERKPQVETRMGFEKSTVEYDESALYDDGFGEYPVLLDVDEIPSAEVSETSSSVYVEDLAHSPILGQTHWPKYTISQRVQKRQAGQLPIQKYERSPKVATSNQTNVSDQNSVLPELVPKLFTDPYQNDEEFVFNDYASIINRLER